ncbi:MAG: hypothetical protein P8K10_03815, partial [Crocinitomicaceae bacterium]|nr:hypothetical protein [Crocinitomicaceae bacterium]
MKNFYIILFSFLISLTANAQVKTTNYNSKWFLGFNTGATWSCDDVNNIWKWRSNENYYELDNDNYGRTIPFGWGLTLGKSFNYDYGRIFSFDLRGRYLHGKWYGQNIEMDSISMESFDPFVNIEDADAQEIKQMYQAAYGGYIHNYKNDIHRLSLELVLHFNRFREKTRIDPYLFGGVGLSFKKTMGDLLDNNGDLYSENTLLNNDLDFDFETQLNPDENQVHFMPSAGFGIGYQIAPRVSLGFEHKTTFTLKDQFDGVLSETPRLKNDWYHYTSAFIRFGLGGRNNSSSSSSNSSSGFSNNESQIENCPSPDIYIYNTQNEILSNQTIQISAKIKNVSDVNEIKLMDANRMLLPFEFDSYSNKLTAIANLVSGKNTFYIKANNNCGSDMEELNVNFADCISPEGNFISPSQNALSVENSNYQLRAHFNHLKSASMIKLFVNNVQVYGFSFDVNTGTLESDLTLFSGNNNIRIVFENPCGNGVISTSLNYIECTPPNIELIHPTASGSTTNDRVHEIEVLLTGSNIESANIETKLNGNLINKSDNNNWNFNQGVLKFNVTLINGINQITIEVSNDCGNESLTFTLDLEDCNPPSIVFKTPINGTTVQNSSINISAQIQNISGPQGLSYQLNGNVISGISYNATNGLVSGNLVLSAGDNYFTISAMNDCGADVETVHVVFDECKIPNINVISSNNQVTNDNYTFQASIENMPTQNGITLTLNGQNINFSYNNGLVTSHVTLQPGQNQFFILAVRACGRDNENLSLVFNNCKAPSVSFDTPNSSNLVSSQSKYLMIASTNNIDNSNQINVLLNGSPIPFAFANNKIKALVMLDKGVNNFKIEVENPCGEDEENVNVVFDPCLVPNLSFSGNMAALVSASSNSSVSSLLPINFTIENYSAATNVVISNNGNIIPSHTYQIYNGVLNGTVNLSNGINTISIQAISPCGSDSESIVVSYVEETPAPDSPNPNTDIEEEEESNTDDNDSNDEGDSNEDDNGENTDDNDSNDEGDSNEDDNGENTDDNDSNDEGDSNED